MAGGQQIDMVQHANAEALIVGLDHGPRILSQMNLVPFQHGRDVEAGRLEQLHLDLGIAFRIAVQKRRQHAFDVLRRPRDFEHAGVALLERSCPFANCTGIV